MLPSSANTAQTSSPQGNPHSHSIGHARIGGYSAVICNNNTNSQSADVGGYNPDEAAGPPLYSREIGASPLSNLVSAIESPGIAASMATHVSSSISDDVIPVSSRDPQL